MKPTQHFLWLAVCVAAFFFGRTTSPIPAANRTTLTRLAPASGSMLESQESFHGAMVETNPLAHWENVLDEVDPRRREESALDLVIGLAPDECEALISQLDQVPRSLRRDELQRLIFERWAEFDGEGALASAQSRPGDEREKAVASVVRGWVASDPGSAWAWISGSARATGSWDGIAHNYYRAAIESLARRGGGSIAADLIAGTPESRAPERLVPILAKSWSREDLVATTEWVESFPEDGQRREAGIRAIAHSLTLVGADVALLWAQSLETTDLEFALGTVAMSWTQVGDKADVAAWISAQTPNPIYDGALAAVGYAIAVSDPEKAFKLLSSQVDPEKRDRSLVHALGNIMSLQEPAKAMVWAQSISEVGPRTRTIGNIYRNWSRRDPAAARAYVENSAEIPPELQQRLLQRP